MEYEVKIVPGPQSERFKPVAQVKLEGKIVESAVFENVYVEADITPKTGDAQNMMLYMARACGSLLAFSVLLRKRRWE